MTGTVWDPVQYERYKAYRDRPALDLLVQIPGDLDPKDVWDLGCGTGEHAALLKRRHPKANVHGLDSSASMLEAARQRSDEVDWVRGGVEDWSPASAPDLIFSNAALHWLPDHAQLFPRLMATLRPGGVFACQVPMSYRAEWYDSLREAVQAPEWRDRMAAVDGPKPLLDPDAYYDTLAPLSASVDIWTTTYLHVLTGKDPVVEWMKGTGLRPYLQALGSEEEQARFTADYAARVGRSFPVRPDGTTLFPFPRLFVLARRA